MIAFVVRRIAQAVIVMLTVGLIAFSLFNYVGDPINNLVGQDTSLEDRSALRERLGLNDPFFVQFGRFAVNAARGDFGISYQQRRPVSKLIAERLPATLELSIIAAILALSIEDVVRSWGVRDNIDLSQRPDNVFDLRYAIKK